ncbi:MAG: ABC transporter permease [Candidatus Bathyarchaeia archaeon]
MGFRALASEVIRVSLVLAISFAVVGLIIVVTGENALKVFQILIQSAFGSVQGFCDTLAAATPLTLTGLATAIAFRAGLFNVGVEGSLYLGAFAAAWVGFTFTSLSRIVILFAAFVLAMLAGGVWALGPGIVKVKYNVDEIVTTLMLNYIAIFGTTYLVTYIYGVPGFANAMSYPVAAQARLTRLAPPSQLNTGFVIAIVCAAICWLFIKYSVYGYELRIFGTNPVFAKWVGMPNHAIAIRSMFLSGALGGVAGAVQILGIHYRFIANFSPGFGYTGIAVALLAKNNPLAVIFSALLLGAIYNGESIVELMTNIPMEIPRIFEGIIIALTSAQYILPRIKIIRGDKNANK